MIVVADCGPFSYCISADSEGCPLELSFDSKTLRTLCENGMQAEHELGLRVSEALRHRLADLRAATSVKDLLAGRPRLLVAEGSQSMVVDLCEGYQIVFCANHSKAPLTESGKLDWARVTRIKLLGIDKSDV